MPRSCLLYFMQILETDAFMGGFDLWEQKEIVWRQFWSEAGILQNVHIHILDEALNSSGNINRYVVKEHETVTQRLVAFQGIQSKWSGKNIEMPVACETSSTVCHL